MLSYRPLPQKHKKEMFRCKWLQMALIRKLGLVSMEPVEYVQNMTSRTLKNGNALV